MKNFAGKIALVTGGGTGMGRELARQLVQEGCTVAICDVSAKNMAETVALCQADGLPQGTRVIAYVADVSSESQLQGWRDQVIEELNTDKIHLLFNNAGIYGAGSLITDSREAWERTFNVCWNGVYFSVRTFLPMMMKADEGYIVNTSSICGFYASIGPDVAHTGYSAAKFAVKGFTEAMITDLALNAPHIRCSVVMPGNVGTDIGLNSRQILANEEDLVRSPKEMAEGRARLTSLGVDVSTLSDEAVDARLKAQARAVKEAAPVSAAQAAKIILDGVKAEQWRILIGDDAVQLDKKVRQFPEQAYDRDFFDLFTPEVRAAMSKV